MWKIFLYAVLLNFAVSKYFIMGPSQFTILKVTPCPEYKNLPMVLECNLHMYNKTTQLIDGKVILPMDLDETVGIYVKAAKVDKNVKQQNAFSIDENNACEILNRFVGPLWNDIERQIGLDPGKCPLKQGEYTVKDLFVNLKKMKVQMFLEGIFETRTMFKQDKKILFCYDWQVKLEPKKD